MKNIAVIVKQGKISWSPTKIAVGLNDYLNNKGYSSKVYIAAVNVSSPSFVFSNKIDLAIHKLLFRLTGKDGCYSHFSTRKLLREFDRNNVDTIYIAMLHSFFINETMLFDYIKKRGIHVVNIMLDEYAYSGKCHFNFGCKELERECVSCPHLGKHPVCLMKSGPHKVFLRKKRNYEGTDMVFVGLDQHSVFYQGGTPCAVQRHLRTYEDHIGAFIIALLAQKDFMRSRFHHTDRMLSEIRTIHAFVLYLSATEVEMAFAGVSILIQHYVDNVNATLLYVIEQHRLIDEKRMQHRNIYCIDIVPFEFSQQFSCRKM